MYQLVGADGAMMPWARGPNFRVERQQLPCDHGCMVGRDTRWLPNGSVEPDLMEMDMKKLGMVKKVAVETPAPAKKKVVTGDSVTNALMAANKAAKAKAVKATDAPAEPKAAKAPKEPKAPKAPKERTASKFTSKDVFAVTLADGTVHNGRLRVSEFQDFTFQQNGLAKVANRKTDEELTKVWQAQFPDAVTFNVFHVKGARRDYNAGKHSKMFGTAKRGDDVSVEYGPDKTPVTGAAKKTVAPVPDTQTA